jgi:hypothetical protein
LAYDHAQITARAARFNKELIPAALTHLESAVKLGARPPAKTDAMFASVAGEDRFNAIVLAGPSGATPSKSVRILDPGTP